MTITERSAGKLVRGSGRLHLLLVLVIVSAVGVPVVLAADTGSLGIPHNDAWSHARIAQTFAETGTIRLIGWNRTALIGQIVALGPMGGSVTVQNLFASLCAAVALGATWQFTRRRTTRGYALLVVTSLAILPDFGLLSTSYMSDMPALAGTMLCLVLLDAAVGRTSTSCAVAATAVALEELSRPVDEDR